MNRFGLLLVLVLSRVATATPLPIAEVYKSTKVGEMTAAALKITTKDNGCGFDPTSRPGPDEGHFGLLGIQERLDRMSGTLDIVSSPGHGAVFTITIES